MKKLALTLAIALTLGLSAMAQDGGLLNRGVTFDKGGGNGMRGGGPNLPGHDATNDAQAPLGSGAALLIGLGAAYLVGKKRTEE